MSYDYDEILNLVDNGHFIQLETTKGNLKLFKTIHSNQPSNLYAFIKSTQTLIYSGIWSQQETIKFLQETLSEKAIRLSVV